MNDQAPNKGPAAEHLSRYVPGLSAKLLLLTILFVMVAEVFVFVPSVSNFRRQWLMERLAAAQIASLAAEAAPGGELPATLRDKLLDSAKVKAIAVKRANSRVLIIEMDMPTEIGASFDLRDASWLSLITDALMVYVAPDDRVIRVVGEPGFNPGETIDVVMGEGPLKTAMIRYGLDILGLSILISIITATLVYLALDALWNPTKLTWNMVRFAEQPEDPTRIIAPSSRRDEIGTAERELSAMQHELSETLSQKTRLAAWGLAVSKISHDLRNMLSSAQLLSDRLAAVKDPTVQRLVPKLIVSLDRAIRLCVHTLDFGQAQESPPRRKRFELAPLVSEIGDSLGLPRDDHIGWSLDIEDALEVDADRDQLYRVLSNLCRNAVQALDSDGGRAGEIIVVARREGTVAIIDVADTGPGVPEQARARLFQAFQTVSRKGGSGLGLAIAAELVQAHGGQIELLRTTAAPPSASPFPTWSSSWNGQGSAARKSLASLLDLLGGHRLAIGGPALIGGLGVFIAVLGDLGGPIVGPCHHHAVAFLFP
ncbi:sensor histidine kinase [Methyloceanibacter superfactus]|uniref:sensor histidine kinase n=1 Tax=Methyloceanibacter superfactus TaxID=1774969 RepID=UPI000AE1A595|nr:HAMP domain-containing sensor histidine kinase [Methyloceanibacter superfactus]